MRCLIVVACLALPFTACKQEASDAEARQPERAASAGEAAPAIYGLSVTTIDGEERSLADFRGEALLIVNTASECGFTPQYEGLQTLHERYAERGFAVLGFPSNDFGGQEPGTEEEIEEFCRSKFDVTFPLFAKVKTKGEGQSPLYALLTEKTSEEIRGPVKWNFTKFLVDPAGEVIARFEPKVEPMDDALVEAVEGALPTPESD